MEGETSEPFPIDAFLPGIKPMLTSPLPSIWKDLTSQQQQDLDKLFSPINLKCSMEPNSIFDYRAQDFINKIPLATTKACLQELISKGQRDINSINPLKGMRQQYTGPTLSPDDVIVTISIHNIKNNMKLTSLDVLSSQTLVHVRDMITCISDDAHYSVRAHGAFFYIENCFYNDSRESDWVDYSKNVIEFLKQRPGHDNITSCSMENVTLDQLNPRLGYPYVYVHQGDCEHVIRFDRVRLPHSTDIKYKAGYPCIVFKRREQPEICDICEIYLARYMTYNDSMANKVPAFFCEKCYGPLHNDINGNLIVPGCETYPYPPPPK